MRKVLSLIATTFVLSACATSDPTKIEFSENSQKSLILIKVSPALVDFFVEIGRYNAPDMQLTWSILDGAYSFAGPKPGETQYMARVIEPGTYVFVDLWEQGFWAVCFAGGSKSFTVKPGQAVFLGELNSAVHLSQLGALVREHGDFRATNSDVFHYFDGIIPPQVGTPSSNSPDFQAAKAFEAQFMPMLHGRLEPASYEAAKFPTGFTLGGSKRICGGYNRNNPANKPQPAQPAFVDR
jgi:hypothetical protein